MKRWEYMLLIIAVGSMAFSYGHSILPECRPIKTAEYTQFNGVSVPLLPLSRLMP